MAEVNWTKQALKDIDRIAEFIAKDSEYYASIQVTRFFEATTIVGKQPLAGKIVVEKQDPSVREIIEGNYRIIYRVVTEHLVDILTVHHVKRLLSNNPYFKKS